MGFSLINQAFLDTSIYGNPHISRLVGHLASRRGHRRVQGAQGAQGAQGGGSPPEEFHRNVAPKKNNLMGVLNLLKATVGFQQLGGGIDSIDHS